MDVISGAGLKLHVRYYLKLYKCCKRGIKMDWLRAAVDSYKELLEIGMSIYKDKEKAIIYANGNSTAGSKTKDVAIKEFFK